MTPPPDRPRKPEWLRVRLPGGEAQARFAEVRERFHARDLHTVCEEARCPNIFECWGQGTATIMILGETCTRGCKFCSVKSGNPGGYVDPREPDRSDWIELVPERPETIRGARRVGGAGK